MKKYNKTKICNFNRNIFHKGYFNLIFTIFISLFIAQEFALAQGSYDIVWKKPRRGMFKGIAYDRSHNLTVFANCCGVIGYSEDTCKSWKEVVLTNESRDLNSVEFFDINNIVVAGNSGAFYKSMDRARNWQKVSSPQNVTVRRIATDTIYSTHYGIAVCENGVILRSSNNGNTWQQINSPTTNRLNDVKARNGVVIAVGENNTLLRSEDAGLSFIPINSGLDSNNYSINRVAFTKQNRCFAFAQYAHLLHSEDNGKTWRRHKDDTREPQHEKAYEGYFGVAFYDSLFGIATMGYYTAITKDGGEEWDFLTTVDNKWFGYYDKFLFARKNLILHTDQFEDMGYSYIKDGVDLTKLYLSSYSYSDFGDFGIYNLEVSKDGRTFAFREDIINQGDSSTIFTTQNGGQTYKPTLILKRKSQYDYYPFYYIKPESMNEFYTMRFNQAFDENNKTADMLKSTDAGVTWQEISRFNMDSETPYGVYEIIFKDQNIAYGLNEKKIFRSTDGYKTWKFYKTLKDSAAIYAIDKYKIVNDKMLIEARRLDLVHFQVGIIDLKTDSLRELQLAFEENGFQQGFGSDVEMLTENRMLLCVPKDKNFVEIRLTTDGGKKWDIVYTKRDFAFYGDPRFIFADSLNGLLVYGNPEWSILRTTDGGATWVEQKNDLIKWLKETTTDILEMEYPTKDAIYFTTDRRMIIRWNIPQLVGNVNELNSETKKNGYLVQQIAKNEISIKPKNPLTEEYIKSAKIYNSLGEEEMQLNFADREKEISFSAHGLSAGMYFITVKLRDENSETLLFRVEK